MTRPPLAKNQLWLPKGDPKDAGAREIVDLDDESVHYTEPNSGKRKTRHSDTVQRFVHWILVSESKEITVVFSEKSSELLVE